MSGDSARISPTAHYTGYVWARAGLSHPELETREGRVLFEALRPAMLTTGALGAPRLEPYLLARHRALDALLERAIEQEEITQIVEIACGLSPRGWRMSQRYGQRITYIEADLPGMAERKRRALERMHALSEHHRVQPLDALADDGPESLVSLTETLEPERGLAVVTEGLLSYLPRDAVESLWRRLAVALAGFSRGRYFSELHVGDIETPLIRGFRLLLSAFVRGQVNLHWATAPEAREALQAAGFSQVSLRPADELVPDARGPGSDLAEIIDAAP